MFLFALKKGEKRGIFDQEGKFKKRVRRKNKMGPEKKQNGTGEMRNCPCIGGGIEIRKMK